MPGKETHYRNEAEGLKNYIRENFMDEKMHGEFIDAVYNPTEEEVEWLTAIDEIEAI